MIQGPDQEQWWPKGEPDSQWHEAKTATQTSKLEDQQNHAEAASSEHCQWRVRQEEQQAEHPKDLAVGHDSEGSGPERYTSHPCRDIPHACLQNDQDANGPTDYEQIDQWANTG